MQGFKISKVARPAKARAAQFHEEEDAEELPQQHACPPATNSQTAAEAKEAGDQAAAAGEWGRALRYWDAALAASPANAHKLHESKAQILLEVGEDWRALQCATRAVELQPGWPAGHLTLARAQLNLGEPELALASMERVLQLEPGQPEAAAEIGSIRALVLRRQQGGGPAAGQRAQVRAAGAEADAAAGSNGGPP